MHDLALSEKVIVVMRDSRPQQVLDKVISYQRRFLAGALLVTFEPGDLWLVSTTN